MLIKQFPAADIVKGKMCIDPAQGFRKMGMYDDWRQKVRQRWEKPAEGIAKLNTDGAFAENGAAAGMVLRDHKGEVISWHAVCSHTVRTQ